MILPTISIEQNNVIQELELGNNVIIDSVAGSGKTTTNLHIATHFTDKKMLLLTYNAKLKLETREKIEFLKLKNIEVHSFHSFCVRYYDNNAYTDSVLSKIISTDIKSSLNINYDIIIIDEAQDMSPLYYELICKIMNENKNRTYKICILGDINQSIFDFNRADHRFIKFANKLFITSVEYYNWTPLKLSTSYRLTNEMAEFINNCMLHKDRIHTNKMGDKPSYLICDTFINNDSNMIFKEVVKYLDMGYLPNDIFILAPSLKNTKHPARILENLLKTEIENINIFVPVSDDEKLDNEVLEGKIVFSTFHQAKGLERKVVLVFNFDNSYFLFFNKNGNPNICPNTLYVATTRAKEQLTLIHHECNDFLPFLNESPISFYCDMNGLKKIKIKKQSRYSVDKINDLSVTDLIKHIPQEIMDKCYDMLSITTIREKTQPIEIQLKTQQEDIYENVSEITGIAVPLFFEYKTKGVINLYDELIKCNFEKSFKKKPSRKFMGSFVFKNNPNAPKIEEPQEPQQKQYSLCDINIDTIQPDELLYISNCWNSKKNGYLCKMFQIKCYDWMSEENLNICFERLCSLNISNNAKFEKHYSAENEPELFNRKLIGYIDCNDKDYNNIYEFKCVQALENKHYIQLAIYAYLHIKTNENKIDTIHDFISEYDFLLLNVTNSQKKHKSKSKSKINVPIIPNKDINNYNYFLYNIFTDELVKINTNIETLTNIINILVENKLFPKKEINDNDFINEMNIIKSKYDISSA